MTTAGTLLERGRELARIDAVLASAIGGTGAALLIDGEPGIGKTALLELARVRATENGLTALHASGAELESGFAFGVVRQCLEPVLRAADQAERTDLFSGAALLAEPVLTDAPGAGLQASFGVLHGLYWLLANLSERGPLLLAVDDVHWADEASLRFLAYVIRRVDSLPVALVMASRPIDRDGPQAGVLAGLVADPVIELLAPTPLSELAVAQLLGDRVEGVFSLACHHATGGSPFLLAELTRTLEEEGVPFTAAGAERVGTVAPARVARATPTRLARLGPGASALARAVALLGDHAALDLATELAGLAPAEGAHAGDALARAGLVEFDRLLRFRHPLLRAAVDASMTPYERDAGHRKAASLLRKRGAPLEQVAMHVLLATPAADPDDAQTLRHAAARAAQRGAPAEALVLLRRALEEPLTDASRIDVLLELGDEELAVGQLEAAAEHLREAMRLAEDPILSARALVALGRTVGPDPQRNRELVSLLDTTLRAPSTIELERELVLRLKAAFLTAAFHAGWDDEPRTREIAKELARLPGDTPVESIALAALIEPLMHVLDATELGALAERAARNAHELLAGGVRDGRAHTLLVALRWTDHLDIASRVTQQWIGIARGQGSAEAFAAASVHSSNLNRTRGRLRQAEADAATAVAAAIPGEVNFVMASVALVDCLLNKGDLTAAETAYDAIDFGEAIPSFRPYMGVLAVRAELRARRGEHALALADYAEMNRRAGGRRNGATVTNWMTEIESHHALGDHDVVKTALDQAAALARRWGTDSSIGSVLRVRGRLGDDPAQAIEDLHASIEHLQRSPRRLQHARALIDLGAVLRRAGRRSDSREPLRAGYELARECGADGLADAARRERPRAVYGYAGSA